MKALNRGFCLSFGIENSDLWVIHRPVVVDSDGAEYEGGDWTERSADSYRSECECFAFGLILNRTDSRSVKCSLQMRFKKTLSIATIRLPQEFLVNELGYLNRRYEWREVWAPDVIDSITPGYLAGHKGGRTVALRFHFHALLLLEAEAGHFDLYLDHAPSHPSTRQQGEIQPRREAHLASPARSLEATALLTICDESRRAMPAPAAWRYPSGKLACLVITDHADWDNTEGLQGLYLRSGLNSTRIRTTKSVFHSTIGRQAPYKHLTEGLDVPSFRAVIDELHEAGHEICPHSIELRVKQSELAMHPLEAMSKVLRALDLFAARYQSATWIDHGRSRSRSYNYSELGWDPKGQWHLVDLLRRRGFSCIWSFVDQSEYPVSNINQLSPPDNAVDYLMAGLKEATQLDLWKALNYGKHALRMRLGSRGMWALAGLVSVAKVFSSSGLPLKERFGRLAKALRKLPFSLPFLLYFLARGKGTHAEDLAFPVLYCEQALPIGQVRDEDMLLFASILDGNLYRSWSNIGSLIRERGIHIAHTYLCCSIKYNEPAIVKRDGRWHLSRGFADVMSKLNEGIRRGDIWNPTMRDCADWFRTWIKVEVEEIDDNAVTLVNPTDASLPGFSLMFPRETRAVKAGETELRPIREEPPIFSLDLPPRSTTSLTWMT